MQTFVSFKIAIKVKAEEQKQKLLTLRDCFQGK
jgi:hypothetical protein